MAVCYVSEKIQTAHLRNTLRALDFFASLHLTIFEQAANFEFFNSQLWEVSVYPASVQYPNENSGVVFNDKTQSVVSDADSEIGAIGLEFLHIADGLDSGRCLDQKYCFLDPCEKFFIIADRLQILVNDLALKDEACSYTPPQFL